MKTFVSRAPTCRYTHTHTHTHVMHVCVRAWVHTLMLRNCRGCQTHGRSSNSATLDDGSGYRNVSGIAWFALLPCRCLWWRNKLSVICFCCRFALCSTFDFGSGMDDIRKCLYVWAVLWRGLVMPLVMPRCYHCCAVQWVMVLMPIKRLVIGKNLIVTFFSNKEKKIILFG